MSQSTESSMAKLVRELEEWSAKNQAKAGFAASLIATALGIGFGYWRLKAIEHPSVPCFSEAAVPRHPFFGNSLYFLEYANNNTLNAEVERMLNHSADTPRIRKDGAVCLLQARMQQEFANNIILVDPELIKFVWNHYQKGGSFFDEYEEILGSGIFRSNGKQWENHRKVAARMFSLRNLANFMFECGQRAAMDTCDKISGLMRENVATLDLFELLGRFTMDSFVEICFGRRLGIIESFPEIFPFSDAFDSATQVAGLRGVQPGWKILRQFNLGSTEPRLKRDMKVIDEFVDEMLALDRRAELHDMEEQKYDIITLYKKHAPEMDDKELRDVALNMIIAGRDTTRCLLGWTLAVLFVKQPEWLQRVRKEINGIDSAELTHEQCKYEMKLTECVLLETLRLYPSVPWSAMSPEKDLTLPNGMVLREGETVLIHHWSQARNPEIYGSDACEFKPSRWSDKGLNSFPPCVFGAFHVKPRVCLGRHFALTEAKTFLFYFLRRFDIESDAFPEQLYGTLNNMMPWMVNVKDI